MADAKRVEAPQFFPTGVKKTPSRKEGQALMKKLKAEIDHCKEKLEEEVEAIKRGDTRIEDLAWEDELEPHHHRRRR